MLVVVLFLCMFLPFLLPGQYLIVIYIVYSFILGLDPLIYTKEGSVVEILSPNSLLGTSPLECGLRYYMWTDKHTQEVCLLSWLVVRVLFAASRTHRAGDHSSLALS